MSWAPRVRESILSTAEEEGLSKREALFARPPAAPTTALRGETIAALLRIGGDSFSPGDINGAISGCGIKAEARETETPGHMRVLFPEVAEVPPEFSKIKKLFRHHSLPFGDGVLFPLSYLGGVRGPGLHLGGGGGGGPQRGKLRTGGVTMEEQMVVRLAEIDQWSRGNSRRIESLERSQELLQRLTIFVEVLVKEQQHIGGKLALMLLSALLIWLLTCLGLG